MKKVYAIGIIILVVWMMVQFPHLMLNPGELHSDHQKMNDQCFDCHDPFLGISTEKCIGCHQLSEIGKDTSGDNTTISFHDKLTEINCVACHTDHRGVHPSGLTISFDHSLLSESDRTECSNCHTPINDSLHRRVSPECSACHSTGSWTGSVSFNHDLILQGDQDNCTSCHTKPADNFHMAITAACTECHSTSAWVPSTFDHSDYFLLDNNHNTTCATCHPKQIFTDYTCYGCHEHSESNIRSEHLEEGISDFSNCVSCHHSGNEEDVESGGHSGDGNTKNDAEQIRQYLDKQQGDSRDDDD